MYTQTFHQHNMTGMALALARTKGHIYEGTVSRAEKARRRAKNKRAKAARRVGR